MRLSGLVIAALLFFSTYLLAQHSSAAGASSSSGSSSSGSSHSSSGSSFSSSNASSSHASPGGGSGSLGAGHTPSAGGHSGKAGSTAIRSTNGVRANVRIPQKSPSSLKPEQKSFASFLKHPFKKPRPVADNKRPPCRKEPCPVCPPGESRHGKGACGPVFVSNVCGAGQLWNGFTCGQAWREDCRTLAHELAAESQQMQGQVDPFQSLRYQRLQEQYDRCMARFGRNPFNAYLLDTPWELSDFW